MELLISEFEDINQEVINAAEKLKIIVCCRNEAFASVDIEAATAKTFRFLEQVEEMQLQWQNIR